MTFQIASYPSVEHLNMHEEEKAMAQQGSFTEGLRSAIFEAISLIEEMR